MLHKEQALRSYGRCGPMVKRILEHRALENSGPRSYASYALTPFTGLRLYNIVRVGPKLKHASAHMLRWKELRTYADK